MVAMSTLRFLGSSAPTPFQPRRFHYAGGMGAISTLGLVAAASPALPHARRLSYAGKVGPSSSLSIVAAASTSLTHAARLPYAGEVGSLHVVAAASPALPHAARLPCTGEIGVLRIVARPQRRVFLFPGSAHFTAAAPGLQPRCVSPHNDEGTKDLSPSPEMPDWGNLVCDVSSITTKRPVVHLLMVILLSGIKSTEFKGAVEWAVAKLKLPDKLTVAILLGAAAITFLFDAAVMGKDLNEVSEYLLTHRPKVQDGDVPTASDD